MNAAGEKTEAGPTRRTLVGVYAALIALLVLTVGAAWLPLHAWAVPVALFVGSAFAAAAPCAAGAGAALATAGAAASATAHERVSTKRYISSYLRRQCKSEQRNQSSSGHYHSEARESTEKADDAIMLPWSPWPLSDYL